MSDSKGKFVISLDCEGKWGMADKITPFLNERLTHSSLIGAYRKITGLFHQYDVPATFAFVMAFLLDEDNQHRFQDYFCDDMVEGSVWTKHFRDAQTRGNLDGWFCPEALDIVRSGSSHEIAAHGFSHVPLAETLVSRDVAVREMNGCHDVASQLGIKLRTFVFPRNLVGYAECLKLGGMIGFREAPRRPLRALGRLGNLASEFNLAARAEDMLPPHPSGLSRIPGGQVVNWQYGLRKAVPAAISDGRWKSIIGDAARNGRIAHLWLHPHNIITGPKTFDRLSAIIKTATFWRDKGMLDIVTQAELCAPAEPAMR